MQFAALFTFPSRNKERLSAGRKLQKQWRCPILRAAQLAAVTFYLRTHHRCDYCKQVVRQPGRISRPTNKGKVYRRRNIVALCLSLRVASFLAIVGWKPISSSIADDLPGFASYPLLETEEGRETLRGYGTEVAAFIWQII